MYSGYESFIKYNIMIFKEFSFFSPQSLACLHSPNSLLKHKLLILMKSNLSSFLVNDLCFRCHI